MGIIIGATIALVSLLIGYNLGKHNMPFSPDGKKRYDAIMRKIAPATGSDVGAVTRPSQRERELIQNPEQKREQEIMRETFKEVINK